MLELQTLGLDPGREGGVQGCALVRWRIQVPENNRLILKVIQSWNMQYVGQSSGCSRLISLCRVPAGVAKGLAKPTVNQ